MNAKRAFVRAAAPLAAALFVCAAPLRAVSAPPDMPDTADVTAPAPAVTVSAAPPETREVVAEGRAAVGVGGIIAARKAAEAQALRNAVEQTLGVFVTARSSTQNYVLLRDSITTHADGFATLKEIIKETVSLDGSEVTTKIRAVVSLRPLAEQAKASRLTRAWRVYVPPQKREVEKRAAQAAQTQTEYALETAGFVVVSDPKEADVLVELTPVWMVTAQTPLDTAAGAMTMNSVRVLLSLRATRQGTGEVVTALSASAIRLNINENTAASQSAEVAARAVGPRLVDSLLLLTTRDAYAVALVIKNVNGAGRMGKIEDALETVPGVRRVTRRSYENGAGAWELEMNAESVPLLARTLEENAAFKAFHLTVTTESRGKIVAQAVGAKNVSAAVTGK